MPYLFALSTEGHEYYLAPEELLSVAEAIHANVVITRESATHFEVDSYTVGWPGEIAVVVLRGAQRGHFEQLVPASIYEKAKLLRIEEKARQYEASRHFQHYQLGMSPSTVMTDDDGRRRTDLCRLSKSNGATSCVQRCQTLEEISRRIT